MDKEGEEKSALDVLEYGLYDPKKKIDEMVPHHIRDKREMELPTSWGDDPIILTGSHAGSGVSFGMKIFLASLILLVISISFTAWRVISSRNVVSSVNIDMLADIVPYVEGGEITPLSVTVQNRNTIELREAVITLIYKQGTGAQDEQEKIQEKVPLDIIGSNEIKKHEFQVVFYGSEAESRDITVKLEYKVPGSNAVFNKVISNSVILKTPPISVSISGPTLLSVGQSGTFTFTVKNNTSTTSLPSTLQVTLPTAFTVESTNPKPSVSKNQSWTIPKIEPGETEIITITGALSGSQGEKTTMRAVIGSQGGSVNSIGVVYESEVIDIALRSSPLSFSVLLDTDRGVTESLRYGDRTTINITYKNNSSQTLQDVSFKLQIEGGAPLYKDIDPDNGYYDSVKGTVAWDKATVEGLSTLLPNVEGSLRLNIPIVSKGVNSPVLKLILTGAGTVESEGDVVSIFSKSWVVQGSATVSGHTSYKNSPFQNTGPIPPRPNIDTTYTVHLVVSAQNALANTRVSFILPAYVTWRNQTTDSSKILYDTKTRTVTWNIGNLAEGKTVTSDVGVSARPSQSHVNSVPAITSGIILDADEEKSRAHIRTTISPLTTSISGENWEVDPSRVVE